jgi:hypothetical protein
MINLFGFELEKRFLKFVEEEYPELNIQHAHYHLDQRHGTDFLLINDRLILPIGITTNSDPWKWESDARKARRKFRRHLVIYFDRPQICIEEFEERRNWSSALDNVGDFLLNEKVPEGFHVLKVTQHGVELCLINIR